MGFKGKKKEQPKPVEKPAAPQEFSDEEDSQVFSEEEDDDRMDEFQEENDLLSHLPAEDDDENEDEEDDEEEDDEEEGAQEVHWGKKSSFFQKDDDEEEDDEDMELEEAEAARLLRKRQASLKKEYLQIGGSDDDDDEEEEEEQVVMKKKSSSKKPSADAELLASEAPEVEVLLKEFASKAKEIRNSVTPALQRLQSGEEGEAATQEGIAYLETKTHLLLSYITNVCFYLMYRAENGGAQAESHPVVSQLVRLRTLLDKLRPLDAKLKNEVDELVRRAALQIHREQDSAANAVGSDDDGEQEAAVGAANLKKKKFEFRPDLNDLNAADNEDGDLPGAGEEEEEDGGKPKKSLKQLLRRAQKSKFVQELLAEQHKDEPEEITSETKLVLSKEDEARQKYEEENYMRLPENKKDRKRKAELQRKNATHGGLLSTLEQELDEEEYSKFRDLIEDEDDTLLRTGSEKKSGALSMHLNEMNQARKDVNRVHRGGDDDAEPKKKKLAGATAAAREHAHEESMHNVYDDDDKDQEEVEVGSDEEHPFYKQTVKRRKLANKEKEDAYEFPKRYAPEPVKLVEVGQARHATKEMIKNRGLTAHRNKDAKNPRSHLRMKYEAKVKARRGQVRDIRKGEADGYQGERSGIRSNLVRSRQAGKI